MGAPRAPHVLAYPHHRAGSDVDHLVIEPHLPATLKEHIELFNTRVGMPVASLVARQQGVGCHADVLHRQLVIDNAPSRPRRFRPETTHVVMPRVEGADLGDLVIAHRLSMREHAPLCSARCCLDCGRRWRAHRNPGARVGSSLDVLIIPDSVTSIGDSAFRGLQLTSLTLGSSVTTIGDGAFADNNLTSVTFPVGLDSIGEELEIWLHSTPVQLATVTADADGAFSTSVTIPANIPAVVHAVEVRGAFVLRSNSLSGSVRFSG